MLTRTQFLKRERLRIEIKESFLPPEDLLRNLLVLHQQDTEEVNMGKKTYSLVNNKRRDFCRGNDCGYWHHPHCRDYRSNQCERRSDCPFVHSHNQSRPRSPRRRTRSNATLKKGSTIAITQIAKGQTEDLTSRHTNLLKATDTQITAANCSILKSDSEMTIDLPRIKIPAKGDLKQSQRHL